MAFLKNLFSTNRIAKNGITFIYDSNGTLIKQNNGLEFLYDHTGVFAVKYGNETYYYQKDPLGNISKILDKTGVVVVQYKYDAWGKCQTTVVDSAANTIATLNPFRYRGYYFDTETGFYFLKTRYYDPEIGRFMTIDDLSYLDPDSINGLNLYAYCMNNPINCVDPTGNAPWWSWLISGVQLVGGIALCFVPGAQAVGVSMIVGGSLGLIANAASPAIAQAIGGASSMANGWGAISTGISLLSFGTPGIIAGIGLMLVGGATMAFGANEIVSAFSGTNYIQEWTGMSDSAYGWTYAGLNLVSSIGQAFGEVYRLHSTRQIRLSHDGTTTKGYRYFDKKGDAFFDFDYPHNKIRKNHWHGWNGPGLTNRTTDVNHWDYFDLISWLFRRK